MACSSMITLSRPTLSPSPSSSSSSTAPSFLPPNPLCHVTTLRRFRTFRSKSLSSSKKQLSVSASASLQALVFDCDGVILESEHLHRQAYNDAFAHFNVRCPSSSSSDESQQPLNWGIDFYDQLQNRIGGGKPKMRWFSLLFSYLFLPFFFPDCWLVRVCDCEWRYFGEHGWPISTIFEKPPEADEDRVKLIDTLQVLILLFVFVCLAAEKMWECINDYEVSIV